MCVLFLKQADKSGKTEILFDQLIVTLL